MAAAIAIGGLSPGLAQPLECSCQHIQALQQDHGNAMKLQAYFEAKARHLQEIEAAGRAEGLTWDQLVDRSGNANTLYTIEHPPATGLEPVQGATGTHTVDMAPPDCSQDPRELAMLAAAYPCRAMVDAALNHEAFHANRCANELGSSAYWNRLQSEYALEEVTAYEAQARALKDELRRVLDEAATVTYRADFDIAIDSGGVAHFAYSYTARSEDIGGASGGDPWTMTGQGKSTVRWLEAVIAGMQCRTSGAVETTFDAKLTTDGLTFSLEVEELASSGALGLSCPGGGGGGGPVAEGGGTGILAEGLPIQAGETALPGDMASEMQAILAGSATVSGDGARFLAISCSGP